MADALRPPELGRQRGGVGLPEWPRHENSFYAVAQAYSENVPLVVIPGGIPRAVPNVHRGSTPAELQAHHQERGDRDDAGHARPAFARSPSRGTAAPARV